MSHPVFQKMCCFCYRGTKVETTFILGGIYTLLNFLGSFLGILGGFLYFNVAIGLLATFFGGILIYGTYERSRKSTPILIWMIWAILQCFAYVPLLLVSCNAIWGKSGAVMFVPIMYFITMFIFNVCTLCFARKARIEIDGEPKGVCCL